MVPPMVRAALDDWLTAHDECAPGLVDGLYVVGSVALGDWRPGSDIDIIAVMSRSPDEADVTALRAAHVAVDPAISIDGPRLTARHLAEAPSRVVCPWTLDGEFRFDDGCFDLNPVMWHVLAERGVAVRGPAPHDLDVHLDVIALRRFVADNATTYWRSVAASTRAALDDVGRIEFPAEMTEWCVLGVARMRYTVETGRIASKSAAGEWLAEQNPQHAALVERALQARRHAVSDPVDRAIVVAVADLMDDVIADIERFMTSHA